VRAAAILLLSIAVPCVAVDPPIAHDRDVVTESDTPVVVTLEGAATFDAMLSLSLTSTPSHGTLGEMGALDCTYPNGITTCTADVVYTPAPGFVGIDAFTYEANDQVTSSLPATVTVTVSGPAIMPPDVVMEVGSLYAATVSHVLPGATVDYGDASGAQVLTREPDGSASLDHVYTIEGTFIVSVVNPPAHSATSRVHTFLSGLTEVSSAAVPPGESGTVELPGLTATVEVAPDDTTSATLFGATYPPNVDGFFLGGGFGEGIAAFDVRLVDAGSGDRLTIAFGYEDTGVPTVPTLTFFDPTTDAFQPVVGSTVIPSSITVDTVARLVTVILDQTSFPRVTDLTGTRLVVSDPTFPRVVEERDPSTTKARSTIRVLTGHTVTCPNDGPACAMVMRARAHPSGIPSRRVGGRRLRMPPGETRQIEFVMSPAGVRLLRRAGSLSITLALRVGVKGEPPRSVERTLVIASPDPNARH
jgi:hypothetical protein